MKDHELSVNEDTANPERRLNKHLLSQGTENLRNFFATMDTLRAEINAWSKDVDPTISRQLIALNRKIDSFEASVTLFGQVMKPLAHAEFTSGTISVGYSNRVGVEGIKGLVDGIIEEGGLFSRNAAAALSIAYVASSRLLGYAEEHMNSWDCLAAQLIVKEAGGRIEDQDADEMIAVGGRVVVAAPGVFEKLVEIADRSFGQNKMKSAT